MSGSLSVEHSGLTRLVGRIAIAMLCAAMASALVSTLGCSRKVSNQSAGSDSTTPAGSPEASVTASDAVAAGSPNSSASGGRPPGAKRPSAVTPGSKGDARPDRPASDGAALTTAPATPAKTLSGVKLPPGVKKVTYAVVFEPYGWAPDDGARRRLLVKVIESKPDDAAKHLSDLTGMNAIVLVEREAAAAVSSGGRYSATISVVPNSVGRTELVMSGIRRAGTGSGEAGGPK